MIPVAAGITVLRIHRAIILVAHGIITTRSAKTVRIALLLSLLALGLPGCAKDKGVSKNNMYRYMIREKVDDS